MSTESNPLGRNYTAEEVSAIQRIHRQIWGEPYREGRGPAFFATGDWWPNELARLAHKAAKDSRALQLAADAMRREFAPTPEAEKPAPPPNEYAEQARKALAKESA